MPTDRLYYDDAYQTRFTARLVQVGEHAGRPAVVLDRTAFYAEGGGQPADHGRLGGAEVIDVQEQDGELWHVLAEPMGLQAGAELEGEVDWARRHDFMQQHHGQHLLSAAFEQALGAVTLSVHMGEELCTVDLARPALSAEEAAEVEELANGMVWADEPVHARFVTEEELRALPLRKPPKVEGRIRIVSAGDFDHSACGGTHPRRTGEVGMIVVRRWERRGETTRLEFICGRRALRDYRRKNALLGQAAGGLSVAAHELPEAIARLREAEETSRKALGRARERLQAYEAAELVAAAQGDPPVVAVALEERGVEELRLLARQITQRGAVALLGLRGAQAQLIFARPEGSAADMGALLREAVALLGGRGGGRPEMAQGGGPDVARLDEALARARGQVTGDRS